MDLFDAVALSLWWAEGTKVRLDKRWKNTWIYSVEITNTDPKIIVTFLEYLRKRLDVQNHVFKLQLQIHEGNDREELELFWEKETNIPRGQFNRTIIKPIGKRNVPEKTKGTCKIRVHDKNLFLKLSERLEKLRGLVHRV